MVFSSRENKIAGFTLIELITVIAIIATLAAVALMALGEARINSRDTTRIQQANEVLKAMELYYSEKGVYPDDGSAVPVELNQIGSIDIYMPQLPRDPVYPASQGYYYCASNDQGNMALFVNTEKDKGGTNYCVVSRGPREYNFATECNTTLLESTPSPGVTLPNIDKCVDRLK